MSKKKEKKKENREQRRKDTRTFEEKKADAAMHLKKKIQKFRFEEKMKEFYY